MDESQAPQINKAPETKQGNQPATSWVALEDEPLEPATTTPADTDNLKPNIEVEPQATPSPITAYNLVPDEDNKAAPLEYSDPKSQKHKKLKFTLALLPVVVLIIIFFILPLLISGTAGAGILVMGALLAFGGGFMLDYGIRIILFFLSLNYVLLEKRKALKYGALIFIIVWTIFFPSLLYLSDNIKLPTLIATSPVGILTIYLLIVAAPYSMLVILGSLKLKREKNRYYKTSDIALVISLILFLAAFILTSGIYTVRFASKQAITGLDKTYQESIIIVESKKADASGADSKEEIYKSVIDYNENRNIDEVVRYFTAKGLLANYYYNAGKELMNDLGPYTGFGNKEKSTKANISATDLSKLILSSPAATLEGFFGSQKRPNAQAYYQADNFYKEGSRFYAYGVYGARKIDIKSLIGSTKCSGGSETGGIYNSYTVKKTSDGEYAADDKEVFQKYVGLDVNDASHEFYVAHIALYFPGPQKIGGPAAPRQKIILMKDIKTNKWHLFDLTEQPIMTNPCSMTMDPPLVVDMKTEDFDYVGKYYELPPPKVYKN